MIVCFSGTGNTLQAASRLSWKLGDKLVAMDLGSDSPSFECTDGRVVWCFPTYSWGVPPMVVDFIARVRIAGADGARHFMLTTCGDDMGLTDRQWARLISARGWNPVGSYAVVMPNTYVLMSGFDVDPPELAAEKLAKSTARIDLIANAIDQCSKTSGPLRADLRSLPVRKSFSWIKSRIIYPWFIRHAMSPRPFHATEGCTGCGTCARACPTGNIVMADGRPKWHDRCAMCLRCYHICPRRAVAYGKSTAAKGQYLNPDFHELTKKVLR